jgi:hypothetical protein
MGSNNETRKPKRGVAAPLLVGGNQPVNLSRLPNVLLMFIRLLFGSLV